MLYLYIFSHSRQLSKEESNKLLDFIKEEKLKDILSYKNIYIRQKHLLGHIFPKMLIALLTKLKYEDIRIRKNKYGKPLSELFYFNISYSEDYIVCVISNKRVGIDIEKVEKNIENLIPFFTLKEQEYINKYNKNKEIITGLWTLKESYIKQVGKGLYIPLNSFEIIPENEKNYFKKGKYIFIQMQLGKAIFISICSYYKKIEKIDYLNLEDFFNILNSVK